MKKAILLATIFMILFTAFINKTHSSVQVEYPIQLSQNITDGVESESGIHIPILNFYLDIKNCVIIVVTIIAFFYFLIKSSSEKAIGSRYKGDKLISVLAFIFWIGFFIYNVMNGMKVSIYLKTTLISFLIAILVIIILFIILAIILATAEKSSSQIDKK